MRAPCRDKKKTDEGEGHLKTFLIIPAVSTGLVQRYINKENKLPPYPSRGLITLCKKCVFILCCPGLIHKLLGQGCLLLNTKNCLNWKTEAAKKKGVYEKLKNQIL